MTERQVSEVDRQARDSIIRVVQQREASYGWVWMRTLLGCDDAGQTWTHVTSRFEVLHKDDKKPETVRWEYERVILLKLALSMDEFTGLLDGLMETGQLTLPGSPVIRIDGGFSRGEYLHTKGWGLGLSWPANYYQFRQRTPLNLSQRPLVSLRYPVFTDWYSLAREEIGDSRREAGIINVLLPNYLARIDSLKIGSRHLRVQVKTRDLPAHLLTGKIHVIDTHGARSLHSDLVFEQDFQLVPIDFPPGQVYVALLSKEPEELIDYREFHVSHVGSSLGSVDVELEPIGEEEIEALVLQGENDRVEFKLDLGNGEELAESIVAFSNGMGGIILIGVDDRGNVAGLGQAQPENSVRNILRHHCEPPVNPAVVVREVRGKTVLVIRVSEGVDKPYTLRGKGVIVRAGSTDRIATRDELDYFYERKHT